MYLVLIIYKIIKVYGYTIVRCIKKYHLDISYYLHSIYLATIIKALYSLLLLTRLAGSTFSCFYFLLRYVL